MGLGLRDYLHEKAEESRHNETISYLMIVIGAIFLVGGILETVLKVENPSWFFFIPFHLSTNLYSLLGLSLTILGLVFLFLGLFLSIHYALDRSWYISELHKLQKIDERRLKEHH
jgi:formate-dependent nitrite reductase membrane component NrfD